MFKKFIETILSNSNERVKNPLIGSFIVSWIAFNWKPISLFLIGSENMSEKIKLIETNLESIYSGLIWPLGISLFYMVILPRIMNLLENFNFEINEARKATLNKEKALDIVNKTKLVRLEIDYEEAKANNRDKSELNDKISALQDQLDSKDELNNVLESTIREKEDVIAELTKHRSKYNISNKGKVSYTEQSIGEETKKEWDNQYKNFTKTKHYKNFDKFIASIISNKSRAVLKIPEEDLKYYVSKELINPIIYPNSKSIKVVNYELSRKGLYYFKKNNKDLI